MEFYAPVSEAWIMTDPDTPEDTPSFEADADAGATIDFSSYNLPTDLTAFQTYLLCLIYRFGVTDGAVLQSSLEVLYPEPINHGRLYPSLDRLADAGLISKQTKDTDKRYREYTLTGRGEWVVEELFQFLEEMVVS